MRNPVVASLGQWAALLSVIGGVYVLLGLGWTLIIGGSLVFVASVVVEILSERAYAAARASELARERGR